MARAITRDPREYRRGMVLGLTLAETLLLLLFLLLMAAAAMLWRAEEAVRAYRDDERVAVGRAMAAGDRMRVAEDALHELRPVLEELQRQGVTAQSVTELAERLERARVVDAERDRLREAVSRLEADFARSDAARREAEEYLARLGPNQIEARRQAAELRDMLQRAAPLDPERAPRAILDGLAEVLRSQPEAGTPGAVAALVSRLERGRDITATAETREHQVAALQQEVARLRGQLGGRSGGAIYPSCWMAGGRAEFVFEISLRNGRMVVVRDLASDGRRSSEPWHLIGPFERGVPIPIDTFLSAIQPFSQWSMRQVPECRFHVNVRNDLRPGSPYEEYNSVIGPLGNASRQWLPFYRVGG